MHAYTHFQNKRMSQLWNTSELVSQLAANLVLKSHPNCRMYRIDTIEAFNRLRTCMVRVEKTAQLICSAIIPKECCLSSKCCSSREATAAIKAQLAKLSHKNFSICYYYSESYIQNSTGKRCSLATLILLDQSSPT
jgi:hypothetical protein